MAVAVGAALALAMSGSSCGVPGTWTVLRAPAKGGATKAFPTAGLACGPGACLALGTAAENDAQAWDGTAWRQVPVPPVPDVAPSTLTCVSRTWCVVFGRAAYAVWDGAAWKPGPLAAPVNITNVSCPAPDLCFGTDYYDPTGLLRRWDGGQWTPVAGAEGQDGAYDLSCSDADTCTILRAGDTTQVSRWDAGRWSALPVTGPPTWLNDIRCVTDTMCVAVGYTGKTWERQAAAAVWSGGATVEAALVEGATHWPTGSNDVDLTSVACLSLSSCIAESNKDEGAVFDGARWRVLTLPEGQYSWTLADPPLACIPADRCFEVRDFSYRYLAAALWEWDGASYRPAVTAGTIPIAVLVDVACTSATACLAVGTYRAREQTRVLTERWDGAGWSLAPDIPLAADVSPTAVRIDCAAAPGTACVAVVSVAGGSGSSGPVLASWDRNAWRTTDAGAVVPGAAGAAPLDVSCAAAGSCIVVAKLATFPGHVALRWDGAAWAALPPPLDEPGNAKPASSRLSCSTPRFCLFLTSGWPDGGHVRTTAQAWNGTSWSFVAEPPLNTTDPVTSDYLEDVDCPADNACVAIATEVVDLPGGLPPDFYGGSGTINSPLALSWNGTAWDRQAPRWVLPLRALSCATVDRCLAVAPGPGPGENVYQVSGMAGGRFGWLATMSPRADTSDWTVATGGVACAGDWCQVVGNKTLEPFGLTRVPTAMRYHL
jgi:hypothetical protein